MIVARMTGRERESREKQKRRREKEAHVRYVRSGTVTGIFQRPPDTGEVSGEEPAEARHSFLFMVGKRVKETVEATMAGGTGDLVHAQR